MKTLEENVVVDEGFNSQGVRTRLHFEGDQLIVQKTYDAEPYIERAKAIASETRGERWGDDRYVGTIPAAIYGEMLKRGIAHDPKAVRLFFKENPDFCAFDKYLK